MLNQEEPCTIEELLDEEDGCISMCRAATPKLIEFVCDKEVLAKLIAYSCKTPPEMATHQQSHKFPFYAADVLTSNITILQAITEGGWPKKKEEESEEEKKSDKSESNEFENSAENKMVQSILNKQNENDKKEKVEKLVEELDQDLETVDAENKEGQDAKGESKVPT